MGKDLGLFVGINQYTIAQKLRYAENDAIRMKDCFQNTVGGGLTFLFTDTSEPVNQHQTSPNRSNLRWMLQEMSSFKGVSSENNIWFFFSGHGMRSEGTDYLLPIDANPNDLEETAIAINFVTAQLSRTKARNIVLMLDACRDSMKGGKGVGDIGPDAEAAKATERGIISLFSCSPNEASWEVDALKAGTFTVALVEALTERRCATVRQISAYLLTRVPQLNEKYEKPRQKPRLVVDPDERGDLILLPGNAQDDDIAVLRSLATELEAKASMPKDREQLERALDIWKRINVAAKGNYVDFYDAVVRISKRLETASSSRPDEPNSQSEDIPRGTYAPLTPGAPTEDSPPLVSYKGLSKWMYKLTLCLLWSLFLAGILLSALFLFLAPHEELWQLLCFSVLVSTLSITAISRFTLLWKKRVRQKLQTIFFVQLTKDQTDQRLFIAHVVKPPDDPLAVLRLLEQLRLDELSFECSKLRSLNGLRPLLQDLRVLELQNCYLLTNLDAIAANTNLRVLILTECRVLTDIYGIVTLSSLFKLRLTKCNRVTQFEVLKRLPKLTTVELTDCTSLTNLDFLGSCRELKTIDVSRSENLISIRGLMQCKELRSLSVQDCPSLSPQSLTELKAAIPHYLEILR